MQAFPRVWPCGKDQGVGSIELDPSGRILRPGRSMAWSGLLDFQKMVAAYSAAALACWLSFMSASCVVCWSRVPENIQTNSGSTYITDLITLKTSLASMQMVCFGQSRYTWRMWRTFVSRGSWRNPVSELNCPVSYVYRTGAGCLHGWNSFARGGRIRWALLSLQHPLIKVFFIMLSCAEIEHDRTMLRKVYKFAVFWVDTSLCDWVVMPHAVLKISIKYSILRAKRCWEDVMVLLSTLAQDWPGQWCKLKSCHVWVNNITSDISKRTQDAHCELSCALFHQTLQAATMTFCVGTVATLAMHCAGRDLSDSSSMSWMLNDLNV